MFPVFLVRIICHSKANLQGIKYLFQPHIWLMIAHRYIAAAGKQNAINCRDLRNSTFQNYGNQISFLYTGFLQCRCNISTGFIKASICYRFSSFTEIQGCLLRCFFGICDKPFCEQCAMHRFLFQFFCRFPDTIQGNCRRAEHPPICFFRRKHSQILHECRKHRICHLLREQCICSVPHKRKLSAMLKYLTVNPHLRCLRNHISNITDIFCKICTDQIHSDIACKNNRSKVTLPRIQSL